MWRNEVGDDYNRRNPARPQVVKLAAAGFAQVFRHLSPPPDSVLDVGANVGINLRALRRITDASLCAVEPNERARRILVDGQVVPTEDIYDGHAGALPFGDHTFDLVFTSAVLMCVPDRDLPSACAELHRVSRRWILSIEYSAAAPTAHPYHGHDDMLFKRDYGSYWLEAFPQLTCVAHGSFLALRKQFESPTWWLLEKRPARTP
jgi:ubiquinone/menaquinone biosynthesis C-methylase UbiE